MLVNLQEYINTFNIDNVPVPDWSHLGVTSKGTVKLSWSEIYIDDIEKNNSKVETHTAEEIESLRLSFAEGVDISEFPPAVIYRGKEYAKQWELRYGFGRSESLQQLKTKEWFFTEVTGSEDALEDMQAQENEQLPKRINEEIDMRKFLIAKVVSGKIEKTQSAIKSKFSKVYPNRKKEVRNRVIAQVLDELDIPQPYILYTSTAKVESWLDNHSRQNYCIGGEFDVERDMYGIVMKEGYQYRAVLNAIDNYIKTGKYTYVLSHCGAPTKKATLDAKRYQISDGFKKIKDNLELCGMNIWPIVEMGYLPQDREKDDLKELIKPYQHDKDLVYRVNKELGVVVPFLKMESEDS